MADYRTAVIGAGLPPDKDGPGFAIGYAHGGGYRDHEATSVVAIADLVPENASAYAEEFDIHEDGIYEDYRKMLQAVEPDLVSVCTPPESHAEIVIDCAKAGVPGIHCEKPMAMRWGDCRRMTQECDRRGVQLTINHQRRFSGRWRTVKEQIDAGAIGDVTRVETAAPDLLDWGTHCFDLCGFYAGDQPAEWILGQVNEAVPDYYEGAYDHHTESQALCLWEYANGVHGIASTGAGTDVFGSEVFHRVLGTEGTIEVGHGVEPRIRRQKDVEWRELDVAEPNTNAHTGAIDDALEGITAGEEPALSAHNALNATELIYGTWESARRRRRVDLPLAIDGNPLEAMIETGNLPVRDNDSDRVTER